MRELQTNNGFTVLVDDEDYDRLSKYNWRAYKCHRNWYPKTRATDYERSMGRNPRNDTYLHQMILPVKSGFVVDHINGDTLDNRRCNLRYATDGQNAMNKQRYINNTSGYKGVSYHKKSATKGRWQIQRRSAGRWQASIACNGKQIYLGLYATAEDAARAYDAKARELFGEYASLNFPEEPS